MKSILIYNPESGHKNIKKHLDFITKKLSSRFGEIESFATTYAGHAQEIANSLAENYDYLFVAGGDGTVNEVINGIMPLQKKPILAIIPLGTVNDVAHSVNIYGSIKKIVKTLIVAEPISYDIFKVNDKFGIYVCCAGLFSKSSYATKRKNKKIFGKLAYLACGIKEIFNSKPIDVEIKAENEIFHENCSLMLILNSKSVAGFRLNKKANLDDGKVELVLFHTKHKNIHLIDLFRIARTFLFGVDHIKNKKYITYRVLSDFELFSSDELPINMDGEKSEKGHFEFSVIKNGIQILAKK